MHFLEEALILELRKKNEKALRQLYQDNYMMVLKLVANNSGTEQEAKDVYQEAIIHFYERLSQADFTLTCKVSTYLYAVCRKLWLQKLALRNKFIQIEEAERLPDVDDVVQDIETKEKNFSVMDASLQKLGEPCKSILEDYYIHSLSMEEITEKFGYTNTDNTKNQKYKCLQRLKKFFFEASK
ncbi:MAG: sigma-70 family RNA polymerase sigma factor [Cyclobacteriaceae bacterium]